MLSWASVIREAAAAAQTGMLGRRQLTHCLSFRRSQAACDLEKSFSFGMTVEITGHVHFSIRM